MGATLFLVVNNIEQYCSARISLQSGVTMLNNIVDNIEQYPEKPHNIIGLSFFVSRTNVSFFVPSLNLGQIRD